ncbi:sigma-70 family RNA polymerase sigma factor [Solirubrobacter sp. CPCC 204708]|uniref:Sigma-70 family RNA polymerase sigma factor n=1 Tax=Solirubrobacter deserti TaxID=2282478 RepID=A0ABT4RH73_9ACTN|nr:sigma-70 family RNA polymerase sigma factor [Solirubrobacter deserti]MBE2315212.1 sigma-70 family RNA polymerase sigma factor [Solirubrobacter deserti]MDA0137896.1 sigma-70 family RNA polymerase sigma factor [Solirubrobacter deserti]
MIAVALPRAKARTDSRTELAARALAIARATALGVLGDHAAAEDVAQEVAIVAIQRARQLRDPAKLDAWLHKVAVRKAIDLARRRRPTVLLEPHHEPHAEQPSLDDALALLAPLPPRQRAALTLRYVHDLPDAAIAHALGCRPATVRSLLSRGREALRETLETDR